MMLVTYFKDGYSAEKFWMRMFESLCAVTFFHIYKT